MLIVCLLVTVVVIIQNTVGTCFVSVYETAVLLSAHFFTCFSMSVLDASVFLSCVDVRAVRVMQFFHVYFFPVVSGVLSVFIVVLIFFR